MRFLRLVFFWRYLLAACLVAGLGVAAVGVLLLPPESRPYIPWLTHKPTELRRKYFTLPEDVTASEVQAILGPPTHIERLPPAFGYEVWVWQEDDDTVKMVVFPGGHWTVFSRGITPQW